MLVVQGFDLVVEEHPRYTFHLEAPLPANGRLGIHDTNYVSSEGTSRLAVRGHGRCRGRGRLAARRRRRRSRSSPSGSSATRKSGGRARSKSASMARSSPWRAARSCSSAPAPEYRSREAGEEGQSAIAGEPGPADRLSRLLDRGSGASWLGLLLIAAGLGAVHAIQPGHGKTLVSAIAMGPELAGTSPHSSGCSRRSPTPGACWPIAAILWWTGASQVAGLHRSLTQVAGFAIAAGGFWRIGRVDQRREPSTPARTSPPAGALALGELLGLGIAGGLVPCWDAVGLVVLATALGRLGTGVMLVIAFGMGMAAVLVAVGLLASRFKAVSMASPRVRAGRPSSSWSAV